MVSDNLRPWQTATAISLFLGYSGYYLCRSNLAIVSPLILREYGHQGIDKDVMGQMAALGVAFYAVGKILNGVLGDFIGGKKVFILGMVGSVVATAVFGIGNGLMVFTVSWAVNRLIQSMGWGGLLKVTANWFSFRSYGKIMSFLSLSYLFGDVAAKLLLGHLLNLGVGWRTLFFIAAALLALLAAGELFLLKSSPESLGLPPPPAHPCHLHQDASGQPARPQGLRGLLIPYFKSFSFLLILIMSFGLTAIREALSFCLTLVKHCFLSTLL